MSFIYFLLVFIYPLFMMMDTAAVDHKETGSVWNYIYSVFH